MSLKVALVLDEVSDYSRIKTSLKKIGAESFLKHCKTEQDIIEVGHDADFVATLISLYPFKRTALEGLKKCRAIHTLGAGYDGLDMKTANEMGIAISNNQDYHIEELSDHTLGLVLGLTRQIARLDHTVKRGKNGTAPGTKVEIQEVWPWMTRLRGKTLGLVGFGRVARAVAVKARAFGMKIMTYDPYVAVEVAQVAGVEKVDLSELLKTADFVSVHTVLNPQTRHLIGAEQLKTMRPGAYIINTARGEVIDEAALLSALKGGVIAGAGLDVTEREPIPVDNPLLKMDNVILTGHSAHFSPENWIIRMERPAEEFARILRGEWPLGLVNPEVKERFIQKWGEMSR